MKSFIVLSVAVTIIALAQGAVIDESSTYDFTKAVQLSDLGTATWTVNEAKEEIQFEIVAKTTGWVGIGLSNSNEQKNADLFVGGVDGTDKYLKDMYGDIAGILWEDKQQDWKLVDATEDTATGTTTLKVTRPFDTKDANAGQDMKIEKKSIYLLWSLGTDDDITRPYVKRGVVQVNLLYNPDGPTTTEGPTTEAPTTETPATEETTTEEPTTEKPTTQGAPSESTEGVTKPDSEGRSTTDGASALSTVSLTLAIAAILVKFF